MKELRDSLGNLFFWAIAFGALLALVWLFGCVGPPDRVVLHAYTHEGEGDTSISERPGLGISSDSDGYTLGASLEFPISWAGEPGQSRANAPRALPHPPLETLRASTPAPPESVDGLEVAGLVSRLDALSERLSALEADPDPAPAPWHESAPQWLIAAVVAWLGGERVHGEIKKRKAARES